MGDVENRQLDDAKEEARAVVDRMLSGFVSRVRPYTELDRALDEVAAAAARATLMASVKDAPELVVEKKRRLPRNVGRKRS